MLLQTNSYIVPKDKRSEHARLVQRFRQTLRRLGCEQFEVYEQVGANWAGGDTPGRFVQIMRFADRRQQQQVQRGETDDPAAQQLIREFCDLINFPYQKQQGLFASGYYQSVVSAPAAPAEAVAAEAVAAEASPAEAADSAAPARPAVPAVGPADGPADDEMFVGEIDDAEIADDHLDDLDGPRDPAPPADFPGDGDSAEDTAAALTLDDPPAEEETEEAEFEDYDDDPAGAAPRRSPNA